MTSFIAGCTRLCEAGPIKEALFDGESGVVTDARHEVLQIVSEVCSQLDRQGGIGSEFGLVRYLVENTDWGQIAVGDMPADEVCTRMVRCILSDCTRSGSV